MARILSEQIRIQLLAKSLILLVYDILARHNLLRVSPCYAARRIEENGSYVPVLMARRKGGHPGKKGLGVWRIHAIEPTDTSVSRRVDMAASNEAII